MDHYKKSQLSTKGGSNEENTQAQANKYIRHIGNK
jgi:hypothetical protein